MDIIKRWLKLKKAQRVRNPWAVASHLNQGKHTGNSGTSKGAYVAGINRNEWNSPEGMEAASERSADYHGMSPKRKKGHKYSAGKTKNQNKPLTAKQRAATTTSKPKAAAKKTTAKKTTTAKKPAAKKTTTAKPTKATVTGTANQFEKDGRYDADVEKFVRDNTKKPINKLAGYETAKPAKRKQYDKLFREANKAVGKLGFTMFQDDKKAFKSLLKPVVELYNLRNELNVKKSLPSSRKLLNLLKETVTVDNDQLEKDFTSALYQAMKKHKEDFSVPTGNNEILKGVKNRQKPKDVTKIMDLPNFTKVKNAPQLKKAGVTDALIAMLAGYKLTPKVNPGEMTPAQQRQWERTLQNQMRRKNIDIDKAAFKQLQNFYKDKSDTYTRRKPAKNGVKVEKVLTSPPFQGAEFDPVSHRWKKPGEVAAKTGQVNVGTGGKRRVRGAGTGASQRSVGGHARGIRRAERLGVAARGKSKSKPSASKRSARIKAFKTITRKR
jgi:ribosomal protein S17E